MSKYRCDDKAFRTQITKLADAGLTFPTASAKLPEYPLGTACSLYRARPCSECAEPANFNGVPARTCARLNRWKSHLPEFVAGAIAATIVLLLVAGAAYLGWRIL